MHYHKSIQRRVMFAAGIFVVLGLLIGLPLTVNDDLRYDLALRTNIAPGGDAEWLSDADDGALLIVLPLDHGDANGPSPWLYQAQFIAWPNEQGNELENLETGERVQIPVATIDFSSSNSDGSLVLLRGIGMENNAPRAFTIDPATMVVQELPGGDSVPDAPGDWMTPTWEKVKGMCNRPSPNKRFVGCFTRASTSSYFAGDWQFDVQTWGDFEEVEPVFRGQGFLPSVGFAQDDTVVYMQNERGIVRVNIPEEALQNAPSGTPYSTPVRDEATPAA